MVRDLSGEGQDIGTLDPDLAAHDLLAMAEQAARLLIDDPKAYPPERLVQFAPDALALVTGAQPSRRSPAAVRSKPQARR